MKQQSLFGPAMDARDKSLEQVYDNSPDAWKVAARSLARQMQGDFIAEEFRLKCEQQCIAPHHHNAWGAFTMDLVRRKIWIPTGARRHMRTKRSHGRDSKVYRVNPKHKDLP